MSTQDTTTPIPPQPPTESKLNPNDASNSNATKPTNSDETRLALSSIILPITDNDFENVDISLHGPVLIFNQLLKNEDTSQWYFLEKVHQNYFPTKQKWASYLSKISPNQPIDLHDIRKQIISGHYNKSDTKKLLNDIGSIFTNAMIRYDEDSDSDSDNDPDDSQDGEHSENNAMYDESQRLLTKFQTLCSEMDKDTQPLPAHNECEDIKEDLDAPVIIPSSDDVFEIEDYYCASPWETLISEIEKQLQAWNVHNGSNQCAVEYRQQMKDNCVLSCNITVHSGDYKYVLQYHDYTDFIGDKSKKQYNSNYTLSMNEMMNTHRDISDTHTHEICVWFGISRFILLLPAPGNNIDFIDESECMFMFSTLCIACFNIECNLSYFVPFGDEWDMSFRGGLKYNRYNIEYICKSQRQIPTLCQYLDGIFKVFKRHLRLYYDETDPMLQMMSSTTNPLYKIYANVRYKYIYDPSTNILALLNHNWRDFIADDKISYGIRWGPTYSPLKSLSLYTIWTYFPQGAFVDNLAHTDLEPYNAPEWCINGVWSELSTKKLQSESHTPLTHSLYNLFVIARDLVEDNDIVWRDIISSHAIKQQDYKQIYAIKQQSYESQTDSADTNNKLMSPADSKHALFEDFIQQNVLKNDLYLSEDTDRKQADDTDVDRKLDGQYFVKSKMSKSPSPPISSPKCVPFGSLLSIFVLRLFEIEDVDIGHIGDVWYKLTYEVSNRWTDCKLLPGIYGLPDFRTCLLQQKLQLLNECIRRKLQLREYIVFKAMKLSQQNENEQELQPQGVEKKHPFLYLLNHADIAINIPLTQDHPIFTADKLEAHYEELVSLGSSMDASKQRAELQSKQLKSDMMAFKAANPQCTLEDFIRWYSPNDWVVEDEDHIPSLQKQSSQSQEIIYFDSDDSNDGDIVGSDSSQNSIKSSPKKEVLLQKKGHLSSRMTAKDNIWGRIWTESESIPAMEQELLFDFDIEGNEALKWIMNLQPTDTLLQICQIGIGNCISILSRTPGLDEELQLIPLMDMLAALIKSTKKIWKLNKETNANYLDLDKGIKTWMKELRLAEMGCACGAALTFKFNTRFCKEMIEKLMIMPFQAQITTIQEKEAVLSVIGQRIYEEDEYDTDSSEGEEDGKENTGFWSWGSPAKEKEKNRNSRFNEESRNRKESIVIYDAEEEVNNKSSSQLSSTTNKSRNRKGRRYELPKPSSRQYVVLASAPRPHPDSQATPNRMHVTIDQYGFKMALATSTIE